jgi:ribA/ribD-fused uncharacterized protein
MANTTLLFYGGPLSNFACSPLFLPDPWTGKLVEYPTVEHRFQAMKATNAEDHERIRQTGHPRQAKRLGRNLALRSDWEDIKTEVMLTALRAKYCQHQPSRAALLATGDRALAENSPTDAVWGIRDRDGGYSGQNLLGRALMLIRAELDEDSL